MTPEEGRMVALMGAYARALARSRDTEALDLLVSAGLTPQQAGVMLLEDLARPSVQSRRARVAEGGR